MAETPRISCTAPSRYQYRLLEEWARYEGRPLASLGASLLEEGLNKARMEGRIPPPLLKWYDENYPKKEHSAVNNVWDD